MKEADIRPQELFQKYLDLSRLDGDALDQEQFVSTPCLACGASQLPTAIVKNTYKYANCTSCNSLFCNPRPNQNQLDFLYKSSQSSAYWSQVFFPAVAASRREKLFAPKATKIVSLLQERGLNVHSVCDAGAGHGFFLEELGKRLPEAKLYAVEPDQNSSEVCRAKGIETLTSTVEDAAQWHNSFDLVLSSEVIEHVFDPLLFVRGLANLLRPGGHLLMTGLGYEGFDILTLGEKSNAISPPHHLNFFSIEGFEIMLSRAGFTEIDIWTPGKLDVDIVLNSGIHSPFLQALQDRGEDALRAFQDFLVAHKLSSHVWLLAKKARG